MAAKPEDIGPALRRAAVLTWTDPTMRDRFPSARDGALAPREGYCDSLADAQALVNAEALLNGVPRRRFGVEVDGLHPLDPTLGVPVIGLADATNAVNTHGLTSMIEVDLDAERTSFELYG